MTAPLALPATVPPLVARLGSDADGERLACLRQLDRVLGRAGMSWTDLARRIDGAAREPRREFTREPDVTLRDWRCAVQWIASHPDWMPNDRERQFIADMRRILKRHDPTPKQAEWIRGIVDRLGGHMNV